MKFIKKNMQNKIINNYSKKFEKEYKEVLNLINKYNKICVFRHIIPDFDALGSQLGLVYFLKENFPNKEIIFVGDDHNKFTPRLYEPMNVIEDSWFEDDFLSLVVDVSDISRISDKRFSKAKDIVVFDHHPYKEQFKCLSIIDTELAAASELLTNFMIFSKLKLTANAAYFLYTGIVGDSGRFLYSSTSDHTFAIAGELINTGININKIYKLMYQKELSDLNIQKYILNKYKLSKHGVAYYVLKTKRMKKLGLDQKNAKAFVNLFSDIKGIEIWCSISQDLEGNCYRVSIRSKSITINEVANKYEGGGHAQASGAKLNSLKDLKNFIQDLDNLIINK